MTLQGPPTPLARITSPDDLRSMSPDQLADLAAEIRAFLVEQTSKRGGHLGPNLGIVELTMALHLVFDSPRDPILFDTGHQAYVHKIITGRADRFDRLRTRNGLSGYPSRAESNTTGSRTRTPRRRCPTPTAWPRRSRCARSTTAPWSPSSATAR